MKITFLKYLSVILLFSTFFTSCATKKESPIVLNSDGETEITEEEYDYEEYYDLPIYKGANTILTDLIHTKLEVRFDWEKAWMYGKATITAKPHFYSSDSLFLDAQGMEIKTISLHGKALNYSYSNDKLRIKLDKSYTKEESYTCVIEYISKPEERKTEGGKAIKSNKGLYFINPRGEEKGKMPQIWTQGETQSNSVWFPTIDSPNAKSTQEIHITVADKYVTLSNGKLEKSIKNSDGTRTDIWKQNLAHAPYLFMMTIGEFKVIKDSYTRKDGSKMEVNYYVEPEWEAYATQIFGETPKMIKYFSELTGIEYPWDKYHQVVVRDYVSGAMENTSAVIFGDFVYKNDRDLLDKNDQAVVAHELFHHWFGDLVTCESWANLPLNESFANYSQYLWDEFRYGKEEADLGNEEEVAEYMETYQSGEDHDLIWFYHDKNGDMFDKHSYNKGGRVLHMLRNYIGDEAFFAGLKNYLQTNKFKAAEIHHLRLAFEEVTGQDLNWFFNQWFLSSGIPELNVEQYFSVANKEVVLTVTQNQDLDFIPLYRLPVEVAVYDDAGEHIYKVEISEKENKLIFPVVGKLKTVIFDNQQVLLAAIRDEKHFSQYTKQYYVSTKYISKKEALEYGTAEDTPEVQQLILDALQDKFWKIREIAIQKAVFLTNENKIKGDSIIVSLAKNESNSHVKAMAVSYIGEELGIDTYGSLLEEILQKEKSYKVIGSVINTFTETYPEKALELIEQFKSDNSPKMQLILVKTYAANPKAEYLDYFLQLFEENKLKGYDAIGLLNSFTYYMSQQPIEIQLQALKVYKNQQENGSPYSKMYLPQNVQYLINSIEEKTKNPNEEFAIITLEKSYISELKAFLLTIETPNE